MKNETQTLSLFFASIISIHLEWMTAKIDLITKSNLS